MYGNANFAQRDESTFCIDMPGDREFVILQLTDFHLGFGLFSGKRDRQAMDAITTLIKRTEPDLIVITGDSIFPYFPKAGTMNNEKEGRLLLRFLDGFHIPYALLMGNHDTEMGSKIKKKELGKLFETGDYAIFSNGPEDIFGVGNYFIELRRGGRLEKVLSILDSNMYSGKWFYDGFDRIHPDQTAWCMTRLEEYKAENPAVEALSFYHMPLAEFKEGYKKLKSGDPDVQYHFGTISEKEDYFGISNLPGDFFEEAKKNGVIRYMFCGHDHVNNISLTYEGIRMTYGMSIDCLGYRNIHKQHIQRGGTRIAIGTDGDVSIRPEPLTVFVTEHIRS